MTAPRDDLGNAGITAKERLGNIETILTRMDAKLDGKADVAAVNLLELRVRNLEIHGPEPMAEMRIKISALEDSINSVGRKLAYATGTLSVVVVLVNVSMAYFVGH